MRMKEKTAHELFATTTVYEIPPYQRHYVWDKATQWEPLWRDLEARADSVVRGGRATHFMGAVVLLLPNHDKRPGGTRIVVDGQQRLITLQIMCVAVVRKLQALGLHGAAAQVEVMTPRSTAQEDWKISPSLKDQEAFQGAMRQGSEGHASLVRAKKYFEKECEQWLESSEDRKEARAEALAKVLTQGLTFGVIEIDDEETQYAVFETLNARGTALTQGDLSKNHVVELWRKRYREWPTPVELKGIWPFGGDEWQGRTNHERKKTDKVDEFLRYWIGFRTARTVREEDVCQALKKVLEEQYEKNVEAFGRDIGRSAGRWRRWNDADLLPAPSGSALERIRAAQNWAWSPVLMALDEREDGEPDRESKALRVLEAYMMRRAFTRIPAQGLNNLAVSVLLAMKGQPDVPPERIIAQTLDMQDTDSRRWVSIDQIRTAFIARDFYDRRQGHWSRVVLRALEEHLRRSTDDRIDHSESSVEHILPTNPGDGWRHDGDLMRIHPEIVHTIGNLTLVPAPLNGKMGNQGWSAKRAALVEHSRSHLTADVLQHGVETWNAEAIRARSLRMADWVDEIWPIYRP